MYNITIMHTDEYQISLNREIGVCRANMSRARRLLDAFERRHGFDTAEFLSSGDRRAQLSCKEAMDWEEQTEALRRWEDRLSEYQKLYDEHKK
jgi:hypothetical protein